MRHPGTIDDVDDARRRLRDTRRALYESNGYRPENVSAGNTTQPEHTARRTR